MYSSGTARKEIEWSTPVPADPISEAIPSGRLLLERLADEEDDPEYNGQRDKGEDRLVPRAFSRSHVETYQNPIAHPPDDKGDNGLSGELALRHSEAGRVDTEKADP
jgi:hypothetical protein